MSDKRQPALGAVIGSIVFGDQRSPGDIARGISGIQIVQVQIDGLRKRAEAAEAEVSRLRAKLEVFERHADTYARPATIRALPAGEELDRAVAMRVMGWFPNCNTRWPPIGDCWHEEPFDSPSFGGKCLGKYQAPADKGGWSPSTDLGHAWEAYRAAGAREGADYAALLDALGPLYAGEGVPGVAWPWDMTAPELALRLAKAALLSVVG